MMTHETQGGRMQLTRAAAIQRRFNAGYHRAPTAKIAAINSDISHLRVTILLRQLMRQAAAMSMVPATRPPKSMASNWYAKEPSHDCLLVPQELSMILKFDGHGALFEQLARSLKRETSWSVCVWTLKARSALNFRASLRG
jgi:hypothetical protein